MKRLWWKILCCLMLMLLISPVCAAQSIFMDEDDGWVDKGELATPPDEPRAVPRDDEQSAAEKLIKDTFKQEYADTKPAGRQRLARQLLRQALQAANDDSVRFVLLREARTLATDAGDAEAAFEAIRQAALFFDVDDLQLQRDVLPKLAKGASTPQALEKIVEVGLEVIDDRVDADDYESAMKLGAVVDSAAVRAKDKALTDTVRERLKAIRQLKTEFDRVHAALAKLDEKPDDNESNLTVGKYYCAKGQWDLGLRYLSNAADANLRVASKKDLTAGDSPEEHLAVADRWWDLAQKQPVALKSLCRERAVIWYKQAAAELSGLHKARAEKRIAEAQKISAPAATPGREARNLVELEEVSASVGWGQLLKGSMHPGIPIVVNKVEYRNALYARAQSRVVYDVSGRYRSFRAAVALPDNNTELPAPVVFKVVGDGITLWTSDPINKPGRPQKCQVNIANVRMLELLAEYKGAQPPEPHAVWLEPQVSR